MKNYPVIKFALVYAAGIIIGAGLNYKLEYFFIGAIILLAIFFFVKIYARSLTAKNFPAFFLICILGIISIKIHSLQTVEYPFRLQRNSGTVVFGEIKEIELFNPAKFRLTVKSEKTVIDDTTFTGEFQYLISVKSSSKKSLRKLYNSLRVGSKIRLKGILFKARERRNPGEFNYYEYLKTEGVNAQFSVRRPSDVEIISPGNDLFQNMVLSVRKAIAAEIDRLFIPETSALLRGLILADRRMISNDVKESFVNSGVIHVLAVSGLHVGLIVFLIYFLFARLNIYLRYIFSVFGLFAFVLITGAPTSVLRASFMAFLVIAAISSNRNYNSLNTLALAALAILIFNPADLFNPGFQLSFSAVLSILLIYPIIEEKIKRLELNNKFVRYSILFFGVSFAAQIGTLPFTLIYFGRLSIVALAANFVVIPAISAILSFGIFSLIVSAVYTGGAIIFASGVNALTELLFWIVNWFSELSFSFVFINSYSLYDGVIYFLLLILILSIIKKYNNVKFIIPAVILITANYYVWSALDDEPLLPRNQLSVLAVDVGQGDSFIVHFPNGKSALIDAGNAGFGWDNGEKVIQPLLRQLGIDKIDYAFISHLDSDHYGGVHSLVRNGLIDTVIKPPTDISSEKERRFAKFLRDSDEQYMDFKKEKISIGNSAIYILNNTEDETYSHFDANNRSCVIKLVYGNSSFLFVGDCGKAAEKYYVANYGKFLRSEVLKVGHHGSNTSSSELFLDAVAPKVGVISCGIQNKFHHPSPETISSLRARGVKIIRTDYSGMLILKSDGNKIEQVDWKS